MFCEFKEFIEFNGFNESIGLIEFYYAFLLLFVVIVWFSYKLTEFELLDMFLLLLFDEIDDTETGKWLYCIDDN